MVYDFQVLRRAAPLLLTGAVLLAGGVGGPDDNGNSTLEINNPNNSPYPASSQGNAVPNEPDIIPGKSGETHMQPSGQSPTAPATSDPNKYPAGNRTGY